MIRLLYNVTEDGIREQLDRGLPTLKVTLEQDARPAAHESPALDAVIA